MQLNDLWGIVALPHEWNGYAVDVQSAEAIVRIKQSMGRLAVMGDDERRTLWLPFRTRRKYANFDMDTPVNGLVWYRVSISTYRDIHYLWVGDSHHIPTILKTSNEYRDRHPLWPEDTYANIMELEKYINTVVEWIVNRPNEYNEYIAANLPYSKRHGKIQRSVLYQLIPSYRRLEERDKYIDLLNKLSEDSPTLYSKMNLNIYSHVWRLAYDADRAANEYIFSKPEDTSAKSDVEMFVEHSSKGYEAKDINAESEEEFLKWKSENAMYHNLDVVYARIHLEPVWNEERKGWEFHLWFSVYGYYSDVLKIVEALYEQGIRLVVSPTDALLGILREDDYVGVVPSPDKYMNRGGTTNQIDLPWVEDDVTQEMIDQLIALIQWEPEEQVFPVGK